MEIKYTNSSTDKVIDRYEKSTLDDILEMMDRRIRLLERKYKDSSIFTKLEQINVKLADINAEFVATKMPPYGTLIYHKEGDAVSFFPERTGLLVVTKGMSNLRCDFKFSSTSGLWHGFYDDLAEPKWSGWRKL